MTARRAYPFEQTIAGETAYGVVFASESERDEALQLLLGNHIPVADQDVRPADGAPRSPGRPSYDRLLAAAVAACELDPRKSVPERARQVREQLEQAGLHPADIPSQRCVEDFLRKTLSENSNREKRRSRRK